MAEFRQVQPDFDQVFQDFVEDYGDIQVPEIVQAAMESQYGPQMAYYLAKNPGEIERIGNLPSHRRLIEMGKIELKVSAQEKKPEPKKVVSKAPAPVEPVRGTGRVEPTDLRSVTDFQEFVRLS